MHKAVTRFGKCALLLYEFYFLFRFFFLLWLVFVQNVKAFQASVSVSVWLCLFVFPHFTFTPWL